MKSDNRDRNCCLLSKSFEIVRKKKQYRISSIFLKIKSARIRTINNSKSKTFEKFRWNEFFQKNWFFWSIRVCFVFNICNMTNLNEINEKFQHYVRVTSFFQGRQHNIVNSDFLLFIFDVSNFMKFWHVLFRKKHMNIIIHVARHKIYVKSKLFDFVHKNVIDNNTKILSDALKKKRAKNEFEKMFKHV